MESDYYLRRSIEVYAFEEDLIGRHMVFIAGPRQFHMMPLSLAEAVGKPRYTCFLTGEGPHDVAEGLIRDIEASTGGAAHDAYDVMMQLGPFPEPFLRKEVVLS